MYSHIIFDLDGTLIESLPGIANALNASLEECQLPQHEVEKIRTFIGDGSYTLCERAAPDADTATVEKVHLAFLKHYPNAWKSGTSVFEGIHELLHQLSKEDYTLSILSNKTHAFTTEIVKHFFPKQPFKLVLGQREGISKKPDPSGIHEILGDLQKSSSQSILIGDSTVDIITARNAGIHSLAVTWGYHTQEQLHAVSATYTANTLEEVKSIILPKNSPAFR